MYEGLDRERERLIRVKQLTAFHLQRKKIKHMCYHQLSFTQCDHLKHVSSRGHNLSAVCVHI